VKRESNSRKIGRMLRKRYIIALSIIALLVICSQIIIQYTIMKQQDDSRIVNISGRQRMLSQRINKDVFGLYMSSDAAEQKRYLEELSNSLELWEKSHNGLLNGDAELGLPGHNSQKIIEMFDLIEYEYKKMAEAARTIQTIASEPDYDKESMLSQITIIQNNEEAFLKGMDEIVFQYDHESKEKIAFIRLLEVIILAVTFFTLLKEILFIFRPAQKQIEKSLDEIETSRDNMEILIAKLKETEEELTRYATMDEMTGLLNKRSGMQMLSSILEHARERNEEVCVCFFDLDDLKAVNDIYGHEEGDQYLKFVSNVIRANINSNDIVFRYGGDEIVLILKNCSFNQAKKIVEQIQGSMETLSSELVKPYFMHFSYGIADSRESEIEKPEDLITIADKEMYKDKQNNKRKRNRNEETAD